MSVEIQGLELTQAVQFYRSSEHLDPATAEPDNAVPLVASKPLWVRVYPDLDAPSSFREGVLVDGALGYRAAGSTGPWRRAERLNGPVAGRESSAIDRGAADQTLNFVVPERHAEGDLVLRARVWSDAAKEGVQSAWRIEKASFIATAPLRIHLHGVRYRRGKLDLPPPTAAEALATLSFLRKTFPVSQVEVISYDTFEFGEDLADPSGGACGSGWNKLLLILYRLRAASLSADFHYALVPEGAPHRGIGGGGSILGVGASFVGKGSAMAQEVGHMLHRKHSPGRFEPDADFSYPSYGTHPRSSIGEFGFDGRRVFRPETSCDFMSNRGASWWVSPYTYRALLESFLPAPGSRDSRPPSRSARHLYLGVRIEPDHRIEVERGLVLAGPSLKGRRVRSGRRVEVRDESGRVLASRELEPPVGADRADGECLRCFQSVPFHGCARRVVVHCCERHAPASFEIPRGKLEVEVLSPRLREGALLRRSRRRVTWRLACAPPEKLSCFLRYTKDGGETWQAVDVGLKFREATVNLDELPGGDACKIQVVLSTFLRTRTAETPAFRLPRKRRRASLKVIQEEEDGVAGPFVEIAGAAHSPEGFAAEDDLVWSSNRQGFLGKGAFLRAVLLPGRHVISLSAPDGLGGITRTRLAVRVKEPMARRGS